MEYRYFLKLNGTLIFLMESNFSHTDEEVFVEDLSYNHHATRIIQSCVEGASNINWRNRLGIILATDGSLVRSSGKENFILRKNYFPIRYKIENHEQSQEFDFYYTSTQTPAEMFLHLEDRIAIKAIAMALIEGALLSYSKSGKTHPLAFWSKDMMRFVGDDSIADLFQTYIG